jgi:aspartate aminotransferase-like enzyme
MIDYLICSSNKCIQSVPGIAFIIANKNKLTNSNNNSKTLSLDIINQYEVDLNCKLFRFTPPTHVLLALKQALIELEELGGPPTRYASICKNHEIIFNEMTKLGFRSYVPLNEQSRVVNCFLYPKDKNFKFNEFQNLLRKKGRILYSRSLTSLESTFRIGNIGNLSPSDMFGLIDDIKKTLDEMNVYLPVNN